MVVLYNTYSVVPASLKKSTVEKIVEELSSDRIDDIVEVGFVLRILLGTI